MHHRESLINNFKISDVQTSLKRYITHVAMHAIMRLLQSAANFVALMNANTNVDVTEPLMLSWIGCMGHI